MSIYYLLAKFGVDKAENGPLKTKFAKSQKRSQQKPRNEASLRWTSAGCRLGTVSNTTAECLCTHLTLFALFFEALEEESDVISTCSSINMLERIFQTKVTPAVPVRLMFPLSVLLVCLLVIVKARNGLYPAGRQAKFWRARSRLYRSRLLQVNTKY